ncbi:flagellar hook-length control protein FliK [Derxia lacustris]|uniref:flagellar hook-length control protein FliK n=1 Tax=Derxia lacustris TaxID=764842 RepID=UPI000A178340|nr:flagellar hook-length control protein FliK [Derxia lacustris]
MSTNEIRSNAAASRSAGTSGNASARSAGKDNGGKAFAQLMVDAGGAAADTPVRGIEPSAPASDAGSRRADGVRASPADAAPATDAADAPRPDAATAPDAEHPASAPTTPATGAPTDARARPSARPSNADASAARPAAGASDAGHGRAAADPVATATAGAASATENNRSASAAGPDANLIAQLMALNAARPGLPAADASSVAAPVASRPGGTATLVAADTGVSTLDKFGLAGAGLLPASRAGLGTAASAAAVAADSRAPAGSNATATLAGATGLDPARAAATGAASAAPATGSPATATAASDPAQLLAELARGAGAPAGEPNAAPRFDAALAAAAGLAPSAVVRTDTPGAVAQADLAAPVGSDAWGEQLADQVTRWTLDGIDVAELTLHPKDLGPIHVEIALADGKAAVHFAAEQAETRAAIDQQMFRLGDSLAQSGIALQSGTSGFESQGQAFGFMREQARDGSGGQRGSGTGGGSGARDDGTAADGAAPVVRPAAGANRRALDLFA